MSVEVEVDHLGGAGTGMQQEGVGERIQRRRGVVRGIGADLRRQAFAGEERTLALVQVEVTVHKRGAVELRLVHVGLLRGERTIGAGGLAGLLRVFRISPEPDGQKTSQQPAVGVLHASQITP